MKIAKYIFIVVIALFFLFPMFRTFLILDEELKKRDAIIVLSGDIGRLEKAAELYHEGYGDRVILSSATAAGTTPEEAITFGILKQHLILEEKATSTYTNALHTKEKMEENKFRSALVVSSDYHMRRVKLIFNRVYRNSNIELTYVSSVRNAQAWYSDKQNIFLTAGEFVKLPAYWLGLYKFIDL